jgi:hypothetical protein
MVSLSCILGIARDTKASIKKKKYIYIYSCMVNSKQLSINSNTSCNRILRYKINLVHNLKNKTKSLLKYCAKNPIKMKVYFLPYT